MFSGIYEDISKRTNGDIYAGIVGPVRTGKSTFIKKFMELLVIPNIDNRFKKERAVDELPQSSSGRSIMTCEPKFVPNEAVKITLFENTIINVRLIDCVGYLVKDALGAEENGIPRMVQTPWSASPMPFERAAEAGTKKVIMEHSTIGIVVTTDGSITEIPRENYVPAEERVISELKQINKPFVILLNSTHPWADETTKLLEELEEKYCIPVIALDVLNLKMSDIENILSKVLYEFPVSEITYKIPKWAANLSKDHWLMTQIEDFILSSSNGEDRIRNVIDSLKSNVCDNFEPDISTIDLSTGMIITHIDIDNSVFYKIMSEENNISLKNESDLFILLTELLSAKTKFEAFNSAVSSALMTGYGIVYPTFNDLSLQAPEMMNESGKFGIRLKATATALHIIQSEISSETSPIIGTESECEIFYNKVLGQYENSPNDLWTTEIFGRKLSEMITDNIRTKLSSINDDTKQRMMKAVGKISNAKKGGLYIFWL